MNYRVFNWGFFLVRMISCSSAVSIGILVGLSQTVHAMNSAVSGGEPSTPKRQKLEFGQKLNLAQPSSSQEGAKPESPFASPNMPSPSVKPFQTPPLIGRSGEGKNTSQTEVPNFTLSRKRKAADSSRVEPSNSSAAQEGDGDVPMKEAADQSSSSSGSSNSSSSNSSSSGSARPFRSLVNQFGSPNQDSKSAASSAPEALDRAYPRSVTDTPLGRGKKNPSAGPLKIFEDSEILEIIEPSKQSLQRFGKGCGPAVVLMRLKDFGINSPAAQQWWNMYCGLTNAEILADKFHEFSEKVQVKIDRVLAGGEISTQVAPAAPVTTTKFLPYLTENLPHWGSAIVSITDRRGGGHWIIVDRVDETSVSLRDPYHGWAIRVTHQALLSRVTGDDDDVDEEDQQTIVWSKISH